MWTDTSQLKVTSLISHPNITRSKDYVQTWFLQFTGWKGAGEWLKE